ARCQRAGCTSPGPRGKNTAPLVPWSLTASCGNTTRHTLQLVLAFSTTQVPPDRAQAPVKRRGGNDRDVAERFLGWPAPAKFESVAFLPHARFMPALRRGEQAFLLRLLMAKRHAEQRHRIGREQWFVPGEVAQSDDADAVGRASQGQQQFSGSCLDELPRAG